ncbi:MAG: hypothetical protein KIT52_20550 [Anaerolineae bacterium]|nr:hypothetical protein [Anaerolineae bacterium]
MTVIRTYHTMLAQIQHIVPTGHVYRQRVLAWFMTGIYLGRTVNTAKVANKISGRAKRASNSRRLSRFLANGAVRVRAWYRSTMTRPCCRPLTSSGQVRLIIDATQVAQSHQLLMVALAVATTSVTIAWTLGAGGQGHSSGGSKSRC